MKKLNKRIAVITNTLLSIIIVVVCVVSFLPDTALPIYGGEEISAIYNGNRAHKNVSLMFNVYENTKVVNGIIDVLDEHGANATFFVGGCWADDNGETLIRIVSSGHEIANHGYFHKDHKKLNYQQNEQEIALTDSIIRALCGIKPTLFAPPSGSFSNQTLEVAFNLNYKVIMWSKDTIDWRDKDGALIIKRATDNLENGDLVLMHPKEHTLKVLHDILSYYESVGFKVVTVSENLMD
ncbi:MAG: polysaccharide deacetylase family protein [Clostridia bacterium]|nr:polysaccharide deacetylase family protein [Clostridia bacterium]